MLLKTAVCTELQWPRNIDISQYPHVEADVESKGNTAAYMQEAGDGLSLDDADLGWAPVWTMQIWDVKW